MPDPVGLEVEQRRTARRSTRGRPLPPAPQLLSLRIKMPSQRCMGMKQRQEQADPLACRLETHTHSKKNALHFACLNGSQNRSPKSSDD